MNDYYYPAASVRMWGIVTGGAWIEWVITTVEERMKF